MVVYFLKIMVTVIVNGDHISLMTIEPSTFMSFLKCLATKITINECIFKEGGDIFQFLIEGGYSFSLTFIEGGKISIH